MRTVELAPGVRSSVLGFGCAPILGSVDGATARRAIAVALDAGVTHFDLARSYGYGSAEAFVGRCLRGQRDRVVIATKFGITATPAARLTAPLKPMVRLLRKALGRRPVTAATSPALVAPHASAAPKMADFFHRRLPITPELMRASLEKSLRALQTDYVDCLFIHEPRGTVGGVEDLAALAAALKQEGKIRAWGLASAYADLSAQTALTPRLDVLQFDLPPDLPGRRRAQAAYATKPVIVFSPFRQAPDVPGGARVSHADILQGLWHDFPRSVVLCSMFNPVHIEANAIAGR